RKENGAPIIEDWVSDSDEENVPKVKIIEMFNKPSFAKINFIKSTEQVKSPRKTSVDKNRQNTPSPRGNKRNWKQQIRPFNKITTANNCNFTKKVNTVKGTKVNTARPKVVISAVKASAFPRKENMYSVDLKNVVPQGGLTCLFTKATPDESNL
ncbi:hypothetical protein Tco_0106783, partial [Tanacetum coccineum]